MDSQGEDLVWVGECGQIRPSGPDGRCVGFATENGGFCSAYLGYVPNTWQKDPRKTRYPLVDLTREHIDLTDEDSEDSSEY